MQKHAIKKQKRYEETMAFEEMRKEAEKQNHKDEMTKSVKKHVTKIHNDSLMKQIEEQSMKKPKNSETEYLLNKKLLSKIEESP